MKYLYWFLAGAGIILTFQTLFVLAHGGDWTALIHVGADKPHAVFERELGPVLCLDATGHDGQINYLMARDPFDRHGTHENIGNWDNPPYRYRRILYPLLAGGFGQFGPWATFCGLVFWLAVGGGLSLAAGAYLCSEWKLPGRALVFVLLNPGIYLSAQVLTNDALALGFALTGVILWYRRVEWAGLFLLAAAVLVRETSVLISLSLALTVLCQRGVRPALVLAIFPVLPYLAWTVWVKSAIPGGNGLENLTLPFSGIYHAFPLWKKADSIMFGLVTLALMALSARVAWRTDNLFIRYSCLAWFALAMILSVDVWGEPGNALRALSPLWLFVALGYGACKKADTRKTSESAAQAKTLLAGAADSR